MTDIIAVAEDLNDASSMLSLPKEVGKVRIHRALGLHPEKASQGKIFHDQPMYGMDVDQCLIPLCPCKNRCLAPSD